MRRESHVRFCEGGGVRFPSATRRAPRRRGRRPLWPLDAVWNCTRDEGRPLGLGLQGQGPNHLKLLWSNGQGGERSWKRRGRTPSGVN